MSKRLELVNEAYLRMFNEGVNGIEIKLGTKKDDIDDIFKLIKSNIRQIKCTIKEPIDENKQIILTIENETDLPMLVYFLEDVKGNKKAKKYLEKNVAKI